jgi:hypothetical protein
MKHEWRKKEKTIYLPKNKPVKIQVPEFGFFTIEGEGNPNEDSFPEYIGVLYSLSYAIKMLTEILENGGIIPPFSGNAKGVFCCLY